MTIDRDFLENFEALGMLDACRTNHRHLPSRFPQRLRFLPDTAVKWNREVLNNDDAGRHPQASSRVIQYEFITVPRNLQALARNFCESVVTSSNDVSCWRA